MPIGILLPKVFTLSREAFTVKDVNSSLVSNKPLNIIIIGIIVLLIGCFIYFIIKNEDAVILQAL